MKTPNIELPELSQSESPAYLNLNDGFRALDAIVQLIVLSRSVSTPPDAEQGTRYIVGATPTGDWVGHKNHVAYKTAAGWSFRTPRKGWTALVLDESVVDGVHQFAVYFTGLEWIQLQYFDHGLGSLLDVVITAPADADVLTYDAANEQWVNAVASGGGGSAENITPDTHPTLGDAADDEGEVGTTIDTTGTRFAGATAWAWRNQNTASAVYDRGSIVLSAPANGGVESHNIIEQVVSGSAWKYRAKITTVNPANFASAGMCIVESGTGKLTFF